MLIQEIIRRKRDNGVLDNAQIEAFTAGIADGSVSDAQAAAFAMAVCLRGMTRSEVTALTRAMATSGIQLRWDRDTLDGPLLDKHSTGGVGDKTSLILAPVIAACGAHVPMISGRGLGHTGGTLDKLEAIEGYRTRLPTEEFQRIVSRVGCAIVAASEDLAPADSRLYAVRDVTATVESAALLTASILSKKCAAGLDALVLDVKTGSGALTGSPKDAQDLARQLVTIANDAGLPAIALLTDMNTVLGRTAGNALEVAEAVSCLTQRDGDPRLWELVQRLGAELLVMSGLVPGPDAARSRIAEVRATGAAAERLAAMIAAQGGSADFIDKPGRYLPRAPVRCAVPPARRGFVRSMDVRAIGLAVVELGGGRRTPNEAVDPAVGFAEMCATGEEVGEDRPLAVVHAATQADARDAADHLRAAVVLGDAPPTLPPLVLGRIAP